MSRMKLFDTSLSESTSRMDFDVVMESAENTMTEFAELAKQNEQLVIVDIPEDDVVDAQLDADVNGIEDSLEVTRIGINAVNALNDTRLIISPEIRQSTRQDIALVRQVATTAAAGMGIDPSELLPENMDNTVGQPMSLNMEGFKSKAIAAIAAIWRFIQNIYDFALGILKMNFNRVKIRYARFIPMVKKLGAVYNKEARGAKLEKLGGTNIELLSPEGGYPQSREQINDMIENMRINMQILTTLTDSQTTTLFKSNMSVGLDRVKARHSDLRKTIESCIKVITAGETKSEGNNLYKPNPVAGGRLVIANGLATRSSMASDVLGATQLDWTVEPFKLEGMVCPILDGSDLQAVAVSFLNVWGKYVTPSSLVNAINVLRIEQRESEAEAKAYQALLTQTEDETVIAYITEIVAMRRALVTYRFSAFAQFSRTAIDLLDGMHNYVERSVAYYKTQK